MITVFHYFFPVLHLIIIVASLSFSLIILPMNHFKKLAKETNLRVESSKHSKSKYNPKKVSSSNSSFSSTTNKSFSKILHSKHQPINANSVLNTDKNRRKQTFQVLKLGEAEKKDTMNLTEISYDQIHLHKLRYKSMDDCYGQLMRLKKDFQVFQQIICQEIQKQKDVLEQFMESIMQHCFNANGQQNHEEKHKLQKLDTNHLQPLSSHLSLNLSETNLYKQADLSKFFPVSPKNSSKLSLMTPKIRKEISFKKFKSAIQNLRASIEDLSDKTVKTAHSEIPSHQKNVKRLMLT